MHKPKAFSRMMLFMITFLCAQMAPAFAMITLDGMLNDWGVTPFSDWVPDNGNVFYTVEDNFNRPGSDAFREVYDLEAMYVNSDADKLYFALVSSNPYVGGWANEDMGMDFDGDGQYEFGLDLAYASLERLTTKGVYAVDRWLTYRNLEYRIAAGTQIGTFSVFNHFLGYQEGAGKPTYVMEGSIDRSVFDNYADIMCGSSLKMHFIRITCVKDWITAQGNVSSTCGGGHVVPEPATFVLMGGGLLGIAGLNYLKKRKKTA